MSLNQFSNNANTTLTSGLTNVATLLPVAAFAAFPAVPQFTIIVDSEIMLVIGGTGTLTWTVLRGQEGTTAVSHLSGATVTQILSALALNDFSARGIPTGTVLASVAYTAPTGFLFLDGTSKSRATFAALFAALSFATTGTIANGSVSITGIPDTTDMLPGMAIEGTGIPVGATIASIVTGTSITISAAATASISGNTLTIIPYGNGGSSSNFLLPNATGRTIINVDKAAAVLTSATPAGSSLGSATHVLTTGELPAHKHGVRVGQDVGVIGGNIPFSGPQSFGFDSTATLGAAGGRDGLSLAAGSGTAHTSMQPSLAMRFIIKT